MTRLIPVFLIIVGGCALEQSEEVDSKTQATMPSGVVPSLVAHGTLNDATFKATFRNRKEKIKSHDGPVGVFVLNLSMAAGGETGWHTHDGIEIVTVASGTLTVYDESDPCSGEDFNAGDSFMWNGGPNHNARNHGDSGVSANVVFLVPAGGATRIDLPEPDGADGC